MEEVHTKIVQVIVERILTVPRSDARSYDGLSDLHFLSNLQETKKQEGRERSARNGEPTKGSINLELLNHVSDI